MSKIQIAFVGAGLFARDDHLPALQALADDFEIAAVYSRSQESAQALADLIDGDVQVTTDLDALLAREDIDAVNVLLPINVMPDVIEKSLAAGKHVISEKPIAPDTTTGQKLLATYKDHPHLVWMVAENWRYEGRLLKAAEIIQRGDLGAPITVNWAIHTAMDKDNKYYQTPWRREGTFQGGFLLDGGVHQVAALRLLLGEVKRVSAFVFQKRDDLPPVDTLSATLHFENGVTGTYLATYAVGTPWGRAMTITCEKGALRVDHHSVEITQDGETQRMEFPYSGVRDELAAFAAAIQDGEPHRNTPEQALQDVAVVEAMLQSAETGQHVTPERFVGNAG